MKWIKITDRFPAFDERVIVKTKEENHLDFAYLRIDFYSNSTFFYWQCCSKYDGDEVKDVEAWIYESDLYEMD